MNAADYFYHRRANSNGTLLSEEQCSVVANQHTTTTEGYAQQSADSIIMEMEMEENGGYSNTTSETITRATFHKDDKPDYSGFTPATWVLNTMETVRNLASASAPPKIDSTQTCKTEIPVPCELCAQTFKRARDLTRHIRTVHENQYQYRCETCQQTFTRRDSFRRHFNPRESSNNCFDKYIESRKECKTTTDRHSYD